jgi:hypothetical protein
MKLYTELRRKILPPILITAIGLGGACSSHADRPHNEVRDKKTETGLNGKLGEMLKRLQTECEGYGIVEHSFMVTYDLTGTNISQVIYTLTYKTGQQPFLQNFIVEPPLSEGKKADMSPEQIAQNLEKQIRSFFKNKKFCDPDTRLAQKSTLSPLTQTRLRGLNTSNKLTKYRQDIPHIRANI